MKIYNILKKLKNKSFKYIFIKIKEKIFYKMYYRLRKYYLKIFPFSNKVNNVKISNFQSSMKFIFNEENINYYITQIEQYKDQIINDAEQICKHKFSFLGLSCEEIGPSIKWNKDYKSGFVWENMFYKDIKLVNSKDNADIKIPWELSRFQHLFTLGKAYWITKDEKFALEFKLEVEDWIQKNPVEMNVNWTCTMDVAIRAVNLINAYYFFKNSSSIGEDFWKEFNKSLYEHGLFIMKNLENKGEFTSNHYLSNIAGLIWLGLYFKGEKFKLSINNTPNKWLDFGIKELEKEMFIEINEDGTNYEASTSYHRLVTEIFLMTTSLCNINDIVFSKAYMDRLEKMCDFINDITKSNKLAPLMGDADDGRFIIAKDYFDWNKKDFTFILAMASEMFNRHDFRDSSSKHNEYILWFFPNANIENYRNTYNEKAVKLSKRYDCGGYYILKNNFVDCVVRCGELSYRGHGGHSHNDQLSFELNIKEKDFFVDPGVYVYSANYELRNLFRSTKMHNTVEVNGLEQNKFNYNDLFYMPEETYAKCLSFSDNHFEGIHFGYKNKANAIHKRRIDVLQSFIEIEDEICIEHEVYDKLSCEFNLILDKDVVVSDIKENCIELYNQDVKVILKLNNCEKISVNECVISEGYGTLAKSTRLSFLFYDKINLIIELE